MESIFTESKAHNWGIRWTRDEDIRLLQGIERFGENDWKQVSEYVGTRDTVKCVQRWDKVLRPDLVKGKWTEEEDQQLRIVVMQGYEHWGKVSEKLPGRTAKQCKERWVNYLDPALLHGPFSPAEDELLIQLHSHLGNKWAAISRQLTGRTENAVKLRFNSIAKACRGGNTIGAPTLRIPKPGMKSIPIHSNYPNNTDREMTGNIYLQEQHPTSSQQQQFFEPYAEYLVAVPFPELLETQQVQKRARLSSPPARIPFHRQHSPSSAQNITTAEYSVLAVEFPAESVYSREGVTSSPIGLVCMDSREGMAASQQSSHTSSSELTADNWGIKPAAVAADILT